LDTVELYVKDLRVNDKVTINLRALVDVFLLANSDILIGARELFRVSYKSARGTTAPSVSPSHEGARELFDKGRFRLDLVLESENGNVILVNLVSLTGEGVFKSGVDCCEIHGHSSVGENTGDEWGGVKGHSFAGGQSEV